jgi:hypothetical protein
MLGSVWSLAMISTNEKTPAIAKEESLLWWRHPFYQPRWKMWHAKWLELAANTPKEHEDSPKAVLGKLTEINCDPDVALRLAFLEGSQKPATKSELAGDNKLQQRIKRKLNQSRNHLLKAAALGSEQVTQSQVANDNKQQQHIKRMSSQSRNHVLKAAVGLEQARSDTSLIFIIPKDVESLRALTDMTKPESVDSLRSLAQMCYHEIEALLWPHAVELRPGHELFTLVSYVIACSGEPHFPLVADLLAVAHQAYDLMRPPTNELIDPPTQDAIEKQVQRFRKLDSIQPGLIEESTAQRAKSGELRHELLTCYPDQALR